MIIFPAIDLQNGKPVRLYQGDFSTATQVAEDALETAKSFESAGATWIHMVDLDGAKAGKPVNQAIYESVAGETSLHVEVGGGIRTIETMETYLKSGVSRVILGSAALKNPQLVQEAVTMFGSERVAVGIDARNGKVATEGWLEDSNVADTELLLAMQEVGVRYFIVTDIAKDGTLSGVNTTQLARLQAVAPDANITASGGVRTLEDIRACRALGLYGTICGKSLYAGTLDLAEAIRLAEKEGA